MKKAEIKNRIILLDVHAILHRAYHALPDFSTRDGRPTGALYGLVAMLIKAIEDLSPDYILACYDLPGPTFRKQMYEEYKAHRPKTDEALIDQIKSSRSIFEALSIPYFEKEGFEADDLLGTLSEKLKTDDKNKIIIVSGDLDTLQLVDDEKVLVYTLRKGIKDTLLYNQKAIEERFGFLPEQLVDYKALRGDPSDNIIGVPGIGEKTAQVLIGKFKTIENLYESLEKDETKIVKEGIKPRIVELLKQYKEEAFFSKALATIKTDVSVEASLPLLGWRESVDLSRVEKLFDRLEFRTLKDRLKKLLNKEEEKVEEITKTTFSEADEELLTEAKIGFWLLDSTKTTPTTEDILFFGDTIKKAYEKIVAKLKEQKLEKVFYEIELPIVEVIKKAEERGMLIDKTHLKNLSTKYHKELSAIEQNIWEMAGQEFNINSPKQMAEILFVVLNLPKTGIKKTPGGAISTKESELEKLKGKHEIIDDLLRHRELQKVLSTYIDNLPQMLDAQNRLHTKLNQTGTTTGRISSDSPNLQNIPVKGTLGTEVRKAFLAPPAFKLVSFDYSQVEMRILAWLSKDPNLIEVFNGGKDVHTAVASKVFEVSEDKVTKEMRRQAKVINFGIIYGMGVQALKRNLGSSFADAQKFYDNYFEKFPTIKNYFDEVKSRAREMGYTETYFGRRRYLPDLKSRLPYLRAMAERMAMNAPLQGTATGDIVKLAMSKVDELLKIEKKADEVFLLVQVHDELLYEIKDDQNFAETVELIKEKMETVVPECPVPLSVNVSVGKNWGDLQTLQ